MTKCNLIDKYKSSIVISRKTLNFAIFEISKAVLKKIKLSEYLTPFLENVQLGLVPLKPLYYSLFYTE
jgi:hypothetical protein